MPVLLGSKGIYDRYVHERRALLTEIKEEEIMELLLSTYLDIVELDAHGSAVGVVQRADEVANGGAGRGHSGDSSGVDAVGGVQAVQIGLKGGSARTVTPAMEREREFS